MSDCLHLHPLVFNKEDHFYSSSSIAITKIIHYFKYRQRRRRWTYLQSILALQGCSEALKSPVGVKVEDCSTRLHVVSKEGTSKEASRHDRWWTHEGDQQAQLTPTGQAQDRAWHWGRRVSSPTSEDGWKKNSDYSRRRSTPWARGSHHRTSWWQQEPYVLVVPIVLRREEIQGTDELQVVASTGWFLFIRIGITGHRGHQETNRTRMSPRDIIAVAIMACVYYSNRPIRCLTSSDRSYDRWLHVLLLVSRHLVYSILFEYTNN